MPRTVRQYWRNLRGRVALNLNWNAIDHDSVVFISASEYSPNGADPKHSPRFVGSANVRVGNISPHGPPFDPNQGVTFVVNVDWNSPLNIVTDITVLDEKPFAIQWTGNRLAFTMQHQQQTNWCWAAVSASVAHYYDAGSTWTQCSVANQSLGRTDCCGTGAGGACNVANTLDGPLGIVGHYDRIVFGQVTLGDVPATVDLGRPLCVRVTWSGGGAHFLAIIGYHAGFVYVDDPIYGPSDVAYTTLQTRYQSTGSWTHSYYTK